MKVKASTVFLFVDPAGGTDYNTLVCLTNFKFPKKLSVINADSMCGPDKSPGQLDLGDITFDGQTFIDPATGEISGVNLNTLLINKTTIGWKIAPAVLLPGSESWFGTGFVSGLDDDYSFDKVATFSGSIGIFGTPVQTIEPVS